MCTYGLTSAQNSVLSIGKGLKFAEGLPKERAISLHSTTSAKHQYSWRSRGSSIIQAARTTAYQQSIKQHAQSTDHKIHRRHTKILKSPYNNQNPSAPVHMGDQEVQRPNDITSRSLVTLLSGFQSSLKLHVFVRSATP